MTAVAHLSDGDVHEADDALILVFLLFVDRTFERNVEGTGGWFSFEERSRVSYGEASGLFGAQRSSCESRGNGSTGGGRARGSQEIHSTERVWLRPQVRTDFD